MELVLALLTVVAVIAAFIGLDRVVRPDTSRIDRRLLHYGSLRADLGAELGDAEGGGGGGQLTSTVDRAFAGRTFAQVLQTDLARANLKLTVGEFLSLQAIAVVGSAGLAYLISGNIVAPIFFGLVGFYAPKVWLKRRQAARLNAFNDQLADTISLMGNSLRSGMSLVQAMEMISRESEPPISEEFSRVVREIGLGVGPQDSLLHLVRRVASEDLDLMVTAVLVQFEVGGNLAKILDTIAHTIRERVRIKGEIRTLTAQQRGSGLMLSGMPVALSGIFFLIAPSFIGKLFSPGPWLVLPVCAAIMVVIGFVLINKITDIEV